MVATFITINLHIATHEGTFRSFPT